MIRYLVVHSLISASILLLLAFWPRVKPRIRFWLAMGSLLVWFFPLPSLTLPLALAEDSITYQVWVGRVFQGIETGTDASPGNHALRTIEQYVAWLMVIFTVVGLVHWFRRGWQHKLAVQQLWACSQQLPWPSGLARVQGIHLRTMPGVGAMTTSWFRPIIWIGAHHVNQPCFKTLLIHELTHIKQRDNLYVQVIHLVACLLWWHPLVLKLAKEARFYLELSCDTRCSQQLDPGEYRHSLAEIMLQAKGFHLPNHLVASTVMGKEASNMRRLKALANHFVWQAHHRFGLILTGALCLALTFQPINQSTAAMSPSQTKKRLHDSTSKSLQTGENRVPRVGADGVEPPVFTDRPNLVLPQAAIADGVEGYLILEAIMRKTGVVDDVLVLRGMSDDRYGIDDAAVAALKKWQFKPGTYQGRPADVRMTVKISIVP